MSEQILGDGPHVGRPSTKKTYVVNKGRDEIEGSYAMKASEVEPYKK